MPTRPIIRTCPDCGGFGSATVRAIDTRNRLPTLLVIDCPSCDGTGEVAR